MKLSNEDNENLAPFAYILPDPLAPVKVAIFSLDEGKFIREEQISRQEFFERYPVEKALVKMK